MRVITKEKLQKINELEDEISALEGRVRDLKNERNKIILSSALKALKETEEEGERS